MSESTQVSSPWGTVWHYVRRYWHWPVLLVVGVYVYQQYMPSIDLSTVEGRAPRVVAQTLDGDSFRLREHRGEVVVVNVWATWCPPCRVEMPGFVDLQRELGDEGVQFVGIAVDRAGAEAVRPFVENHGVNFPQIANPSVAARYFPGKVVPRTYLIDKRGRIRYSHSGVLLKWALRDALEKLVAESPGETGSRREQARKRSAPPSVQGTRKRGEVNRIGVRMARRSSLTARAKTSLDQW